MLSVQKKLEKNLNAFFSYSKSPISVLHFVYAYFYKLSLIKLYGPTSFEVRREYPFLIANNLAKAKIQAQRWSLEQLAVILNYLTISDLKLRKHSLLPTNFTLEIQKINLHVKLK